MLWRLDSMVLYPTEISVLSRLHLQISRISPTWIWKTYPFFPAGGKDDQAPLPHQLIATSTPVCIFLKKESNYQSLGNMRILQQSERVLKSIVGTVTRNVRRGSFSQLRFASLSLLLSPGHTGGKRQMSGQDEEGGLCW